MEDLQLIISSYYEHLICRTTLHHKITLSMTPEVWDKIQSARDKMEGCEIPFTYVNKEGIPWYEPPESSIAYISAEGDVLVHYLLSDYDTLRRCAEKAGLIDEQCVIISSASQEKTVFITIREKDEDQKYMRLEDKSWWRCLPSSMEKVCDHETTALLDKIYLEWRLQLGESNVHTPIKIRFPFNRGRHDYIT